MHRLPAILALFLAIFYTFNLYASLSNKARAELEVYMSPHEGRNSFNKVYSLIEGSRNYIHLTLYGWSDKGLFMALKKALTKINPPKVRIVLHRPLYINSKNGPHPTLHSRVKKLEKLGAEFKLAKQKMHEKFLIVDNEILMNGSANMSNGPLTRYSENMVYYSSGGNSLHPHDRLIQQFKHEFSVLFNSGTDLITHGERIATEIKDYNQRSENGELLNNLPVASDLYLVSSSMNFKLRRNRPGTVKYREGRYLSLAAKKIEGNKTWNVREMLIREIDKAKDNILVCLNHLTLPAVKDAFIRAVQRGVKIHWFVDNYEYSTKTNSKAQTPKFVAEYQNIMQQKKTPVRVKWYSIIPHPRYALLNHHKFILIDSATDFPVLLSGSSNMSKSAEFTQFDNIVVHRGLRFSRLYQKFADEFWQLWKLNRTAEDKPSPKLIELFTSVNKDGFMRIHKKTPLSLTWDEVKSLNTAIYAAAPGLKTKLSGFDHCAFYDYKTESFATWKSKKKVYKACIKKTRR